MSLVYEKYLHGKSLGKNIALGFGHSMGHHGLSDRNFTRQWRAVYLFSILNIS
jgi:hypothetical protein